MARRGQQRFQKRQREEARRDRAKAKAARKEQRHAEDPEPVDEDALLEEFRQLSEQHAAGVIDDAQFTERRHEIFTALDIEDGSAAP